MLASQLLVRCHTANFLSYVRRTKLEISGIFLPIISLLYHQRFGMAFKVLKMHNFYGSGVKKMTRHHTLKIIWQNRKTHSLLTHLSTKHFVHENVETWKLVHWPALKSTFAPLGQQHGQNIKKKKKQNSSTFSSTVCHNEQADTQNRNHWHLMLCTGSTRNAHKTTITFNIIRWRIVHEIKL